MLRRLLLALVMLLGAGPASAASIVSVLSGSDGNFNFSVTHTSSAGDDGQMGTVLDSITLGGAGGSATASAGLLNLQVQLHIGGVDYDATGVFDLAGLLDDSAQEDILLGSLSLAGAGGYDGMTFYFEDRNYSSATLKPNSLDGVFLSLWGATDFTLASASPAIGDSLDLVAGGTGIDLRFELANPIPEAHGIGVFAAGILVACAGSWMHRRSAEGTEG